MIRFVRKPEFIYKSCRVKARKILQSDKKPPGSVQLLRQTLLETVYFFYNCFNQATVL